MSTWTLYFRDIAYQKINSFSGIPMFLSYFIYSLFNIILYLNFIVKWRTVDALLVHIIML